MAAKRVLSFIPAALACLSLVLPWFYVSTNLGMIQIYYPWGIYSGDRPYFFQPLDAFDLPFVIIFLTCVVSIILEAIGAVGRRFVFISNENATIVGAIFSLGSVVNWFLLMNLLMTPIFLKGPGYHYQFVSANWGIGLYLMIASGVSAFIFYSLKVMSAKS